MKKIRVAILFGGKSAEHEVSILSAKNVLRALNRRKYEPVLIGIDKTGKWQKTSAQLLVSIIKQGALPAFQHSENALHILRDMPLNTDQSSDPIDVVFPVLHGPYGEDGSVQGLLELTDIPYVGAGVLGSAVGMDKDVCKRLLRDAGIPTAEFLVIQKKDIKLDSSAKMENDKIHFQTIKRSFDVPFFVKPANMGSSIGVSKVTSKTEFDTALENAFLYDSKILIEKAVIGRELECSVLGNDNPEASCVGEIVLNADFYSYKAKYIDENGAILQIPANIQKRKTREIQQLAIKTFQTLSLSGMARVDFFMAKNGDVYVNEVNTIPGFTDISMYPKLWEKSGVSQKNLIDQLIQLAIERHKSLKNKTYVV